MSETKIDRGLSSIVDGRKNVSIPTDENIYTFVTNTYKGSGGYIDGSYLIMHDKESSLDRRKRLIYLKNYVKGIVDSIITPVFSEEAQRSTDNELFASFLENVDNKGNNIQDFTKTVVKYARMHSVCFTIIDNFSEEDIPDTMQEAIKTRKYPYMYYKTADEVYSYTTNVFNTLESIAFNDGVVTYADKKVSAYRLWTPEYSVRFINNEGTVVEIEERVYHQLGFLPVIATYSDIESDILPHPPIYDLCRMQFTVFNQDSEQRSLERLCAFPMLTLQTKDHDVNINIGADSLLTYGSDFDGSVTAPSWISPSAEILKIMNDLSNELVQKIAESANTLGATAINTGNQAKSGFALSYEFLGQNYALKHTARMGETFETMVSLMFGLFVNEPIEYSVKYEDNYAPSQDDMSKKLDVITRLLDIDMSETINAELKKELIKDVANYYKFSSDIDDLVQSIATTDLI